MAPQEQERPVITSVLSSVRGSAASSAIAAQPVDWARLQRWDQLHAQLASEAAVDAVDSLGRSALHYAAGYGEVKVVTRLIKRGAAVDAADRFGVTPLHWACLKAHARAVEALVVAGADALVPATAGVFEGRSPLDLARDGSAEVSEALASALGATLFEQRKVLGFGGFGTVIKAVRRDTGSAVALKAIRKQPMRETARGRAEGGGGALRGARVERDVLSAVQHPFVVRLHSAFQTQQHLYLVIEHCGGGDLAQRIANAPGGRLTEAAIQFVSAELLLALEALHLAGVIHRDIKAENVLVDSAGHIRLADYNVAKQAGGLDDEGRTWAPHTLQPTPRPSDPCRSPAAPWIQGNPSTRAQVYRCGHDLCDGP